MGIFFNYEWLDSSGCLFILRLSDPQSTLCSTYDGMHSVPIVYNTISILLYHFVKSNFNICILIPGDWQRAHWLLPSQSLDSGAHRAGDHSQTALQSDHSYQSESTIYCLSLIHI